ncbi:MAG: hypothetical protein AB7O38_16080, partial [Pirellulaceae bacterium]
MWRCSIRLFLLGLAPITAWAQDPVFSGPQVGEKVVPFVVRGGLGELAGKELDVVKQADGNPLLLVFLHQVNRRSISLARLVLEYGATRRDKGLTSALVYLSDDPTEAENALKRMAHAMPKGVPVGISLDGAEGPGAYGLNRNVELTVLVAKENQVTANFAIIQSSIQADAPRIIGEIVAVTGGGKVPTVAELNIGPSGTLMNARMADGGELPNLLRSLIQRTNSDEAVAAAAEAIEKHIAKAPAAKTQLGEITSRIVNAGKLANYGT